MKNVLGKPARGFTLMEVMVSVSIFTVIVTIGIGSLLTINANYKKAQTDRKAIDSLTYILESMSRSIRTATSWDNGNTAGSRFSYVDQDGHAIVYALDGTDGHITETIDNVSEDITPEGVDFNTNHFTGAGLTFIPYENGTNGQRYVQINIGGQVQNAKLTSQFMFQTGISKRSFE